MVIPQAPTASGTSRSVETSCHAPAGHHRQLEIPSRSPFVKEGWGILTPNLESLSYHVRLFPEQVGMSKDLAGAEPHVGQDPLQRREYLLNILLGHIP